MIYFLTLKFLNRQILRNYVLNCSEVCQSPMILSYVPNWKNFPSISFSKKPSPETSFLVNFTNNWSFSIEIDFCAKYWRNPISALQFLLSALEENFADIAEMYSKFVAWQPKLFKLIFVQNIGRKLLLALKIFAEMC